MGGLLLAVGTEFQQLVAAYDLLHGKVALGDGAGLIHDDGLDLAHGLHGLAALKQDPPLAARADTGEEGQRYAENQSAGAAHDQKCQSGVDPFAPVAGDEGGNDRRQHGGAHYDGGVDPCKTGDEAVDLGLAGSGVFHAVQNAGDHGFGQGLFHPDGELTCGIDAAGDHAVSLGYGNRHRLAGDGGGINAAAAADHDAVQRDPVAGTNQNDIADFGFSRRNLPHRFPVHQLHHLGAQVHRFHDLAAAAGDGSVFKIFADAVEQHDADGLGKAAGEERADGGKGHQEVLVQHLAPGKVLYGRHNDFPAQQDIGHEAHAQRRPFQSEMVQHQTHHKQNRTDQNRLQVFRLLAAVLVTVVMAVLVGMFMVVMVFVFMLMVIIVMMVMSVVVMMLVTAAAIMMMLMFAGVAVVGVSAVSGVEFHLRLHLLSGLLQFGEQGVGVFSGNPKLHRGVGEYSLLHLREGVECRLHLRCAVGTVQILYQIYFLHHGNASLIKCIYEHTLIC